jgi:hypothetical protein
MIQGESLPEGCRWRISRPDVEMLVWSVDNIDYGKVFAPDSNGWDAPASQTANHIPQHDMSPVLGRLVASIHPTDLPGMI